MSYVFWIDEDIKKETKEAIRDQKTFPEVNRVYDKYRIKMGAEP
jgi:microcin C transport system substrate-binding protein